MSLEDFFLTNRTLLLDGATGTQLMARGLESGECPEKWNVDQPAKVRTVARSYFEAGSDAVLTNTFGGSKLKLKSFGLEDRAYELNLAGSRNALEVRPEGGFVFGSVGPTGKFMPPLGDTAEQEMIDAFVPQAEAMEDAGIDAVFIETFTDLSEIRCAIKAVRENTELPFICSLTYDKTPQGYRTMMGISVSEAAEVLVNEGAMIVGSNCGHGLLNMIEIVEEYRNLSETIKIIAKPNAGVPEYRNGSVVYTEDAKFFQEHIDEMLALNPSVIGGCCGTGPEHIHVMRGAIDRRKRAEI